MPRLTSRLRGVLKNRDVGGLVGLVALGGVADTTLKYLFYWLVSLEVDYSRGRTLYFAGFYSWLNGINLVLLVLGTGRAIRVLGVGLSLAALPMDSSLLIRGHDLVVRAGPVLGSSHVQAPTAGGVGRFTAPVAADGHTGLCPSRPVGPPSRPNTVGWSMGEEARPWQGTCWS
jgi:hypothetical protein